MSDEVKQGDTVRVHYTGRLDSGEEFDSSRLAGQPLEFEVGAGDVIPGFDEGVRGLRVGESRAVEIEPEDAYGPRRDSLVAEIDLARAQLPGVPEAGMTLLLPLADGSQLEVVVTEVTDTHIIIDGNHPLAGEKLFFDIELVGRDEAGG